MWCVVAEQRNFRSIATILVAACFAVIVSDAFAADDLDCEELLLAGRYEACAVEAAERIEQREYGEQWYLWKAEAEAAVGRYGDALATLEAGIERYRWSVRLRIAGLDICRLNDRADQADGWLQEAESLAVRSSWRYTDSANLTALGHAALELGGNPRDVLEGFFIRAQKLAPQDPSPWLAMGRVALDKGDAGLAAEWFGKALELTETHPEVHFGLARAFASSDPATAAVHLERTLELNPLHVAARQLQAERFVAAEQYAAAEDQIERILCVNPHLPAAWALLSVMAELRTDSSSAEGFRELALSPWPENPEVDFLIGRELSRKYRFREAVAALRRSLKFDEEYLPSMKQLAQDLLRLGENDEGWALAASVHEFDGYDVTTFNLLELKERLESYETLTSPHFVVRMERREAAVYGRAVVELLEQAWAELTDRYRHEPDVPIFVEIFPRANDFAVRTFGIPGGSGYLGVCFGRLITANSPAALDSPANWQAVLWHEFAHVVTLEATHNRLPRWLSEGISVYEERRRSPAWGQRMTPQFRRRILSGSISSIGEMSAAFLSPRSPADLNFAYYQASLIVEFLVETYGFDVLISVLEDLDVGMTISETLERRAAETSQLDVEFADYARRLAVDFGAAADWTIVDLTGILSDDDPGRLKGWVDEHPQQVQGLMAYGTQLAQRGDWKTAANIFERVVQLAPEWVSSDGPYEPMIEAYRRLNHETEEQAALSRYVRLRTESPTMSLRLCELAARAEDWPQLVAAAEAVIAVNPLLAAPHRQLAEAANRMHDDETAIEAYRSLLALDAWDTGGVHYELARLLHRRQDRRAKFHALAALEASPRFRDAHRLLLEIVAADHPPSDEDVRNP